jgi:hypothetical protein
MQLISIEIIMPVMNVMVITNTKTTVEVHMVISVERIITYSQMEMVMRINLHLAEIMCIVEITEVVMAISWTNKPVHMKPTDINDNAWTIADKRGTYDDGSKQHPTSSHAVIPVTVHKDITTWSPNPPRRRVSIIRSMAKPETRTPTVPLSTINPYTRGPKIIVAWSRNCRTGFQ